MTEEKVYSTKTITDLLVQMIHDKLDREFAFFLLLKSKRDNSSFKAYTIAQLSRECNMSRQMIKIYLNRLFNLGWAYEENGTLKLRSSKYIAERIGVKTRKWKINGYTSTISIKETDKLRNVLDQLRGKPLEFAIRKQQRALADKVYLCNKQKNDIRMTVSEIKRLRRYENSTHAGLNTCPIVSLSVRGVAKLLNKYSISTASRLRKRLTESKLIEFIPRCMYMGRCSVLTFFTAYRDSQRHFYYNGGLYEVLAHEVLNMKYDYEHFDKGVNTHIKRRRMLYTKARRIIPVHCMLVDNPRKKGWLIRNSRVAGFV